MPVTALYYDGRSAKRHEVSLNFLGEMLLIKGEGIERQVPLSALHISTAIAHTPSIISFKDGARCEVSDYQALNRLLANAHLPLLGKMESSNHYALLALLICLSLSFAAYLWGLPYIAQQIANRLPLNALAVMDQHILHSLQPNVLEPSTLTAQRQQQITVELNQLRLPTNGVLPTHLLFRNSPKLGANALALPGGSVLVLDKLVELAANDQEILAVLAHEIGHVSQRDALKEMLQASMVGLFMAWYVGDTSSLLAAAPTLLLQSRYSRELEEQADQFAAAVLLENGIPPSQLAHMLQKLEASQKLLANQPADVNSPLFDYLSTHPNTEARIKKLLGE